MINLSIPMIVPAPSTPSPATSDDVASVGKQQQQNIILLDKIFYMNHMISFSTVKN